MNTLLYRHLLFLPLHSLNPELRIHKLPNCNTHTAFIPILLTQHHNIIPVCIIKNKISDYASSIQVIQLCMVCIIRLTRQRLYDLVAVLIYANGQNKPSSTIGYSFNRHDNCLSSSLCIPMHTIAPPARLSLHTPQDPPQFHAECRNIYARLTKICVSA